MKQRAFKEEVSGKGKGAHAREASAQQLIICPGKSSRLLCSASNQGCQVSLSTVCLRSPTSCVQTQQSRHPPTTHTYTRKQDSLWRIPWPVASVLKCGLALSSQKSGPIPNLKGNRSVLLQTVGFRSASKECISLKPVNP